MPPLTTDRVLLNQLLRLAAWLVTLLIVAASGYTLIEGWSLLDALYMTLITISTVGFREVAPLSPAGKLFTMFVIVAGISSAAYAFSSITRLIVESELGSLRESRKMQKIIENLKGHIIVCGFGDLGKIVVRELVDAKQDVVVIDQDREKIEQLRQSAIPCVEGVAYQDEILRAAGIASAKRLICLLPRVADSIYVTLCARDLNPDLLITARTDEEIGEKNLRRAGADQVLAPYRVAGTRLAQQMLRPNVSGFLELAAGRGDERLAIEEVSVSQDSGFSGQSLEQADLRRRTGGAVVAAIIEPDGTTVVSPGGKSTIKPGSTMIVIGERGSLEKLAELL